MPDTTHILVENVCKHYRVASKASSLFRRRYRRIDALCDLSFRIAQGELVGILGPNGAGKSTAIKILCGILRPDGGCCVIDGRVPWQERRQHVAHLGAVFGQRSQLWWDLPVQDSFELLRDIYRVSATDYRRRLDELVSVLAIGPVLDQAVRQLSLGQRMRCELAAALLHAPKLLILDEPTIGLDAPAKLAVRSFLKELHHSGKVTILLTTHDLDDVEALCQRVMVIGRGQLLLDGKLEALRSLGGQERRLHIESADAVPAVLLPKGVRLVERQGQELSLAFDPNHLTAADLISDMARQFTIKDLTVSHPPIDELVSALYEQSVAG